VAHATRVQIPASVLDAETATTDSGSASVSTTGQPNAIAGATFERALGAQYRVVRELGRGGMATVYLADDTRHGRQVAIKVLHPELGAWLGAERFLSEIRITARLQHPHILPLIDSGRVSAAPGSPDELLYYVMPYVAGETLRERLRRESQLAVAEALRIATEVLAALTYAHAQGVIHRDIKPENILLGAPGAGLPSSVLVADFGIARSTDAGDVRLTGTGMTLGTAAYMSPEQATGERELDGRTDIYSLGCVLYEMLAGEPPFTGPNPRSILAKALADPVRPVTRVRDGVPPHVDAALATALGRSPADRFPDAAAFASALETPAYGAAGDAVGGAGRTRDARRRVRPRLAAGVVGAMAVVAIAWLALTRPGSALTLPPVRVQRFTTLAGDTASAYLAATLQQDVIAALAGSGSARVFAMDAARLPSGFAVAGRTERRGDSVEVRLTVSREPDGEIVNTRIVRRPLGRLQEVPELAADAILALVGRPRRSTPQRAPVDSVAYDLFLHGRYLTDRRTEAATRRAVAMFRAAVQRDSNFAEGWAGLARALQQVSLRRYTIPGLPADRVLPALVDASQRALETDSTRSYVWIARGLSLRDFEPGSRRNALLAYQRAIALDSNNADAWHYAAVAWDDSLEPARALAAWRRAIRIDPTHRQALGFLAQHYYWMRQYDSAFFWADSGRRIDPVLLLIRQQLGLASLARGDTTNAAENFRAAIQIGQGPDEVTGWVGLTEIALRRRDRRAADTLFARALALVDTLQPTLHDAAYIAWGYTLFSDTARALRVLERYEPRSDKHFQLHLLRDAALDSLRRLPRFEALLGRSLR